MTCNFEKFSTSDLIDLKETFEFILKKMGLRFIEAHCGDHVIYYTYWIYKDQEMLSNTEALDNEDGDSDAAFINACIEAIEIMYEREEE